MQCPLIVVALIAKAGTDSLEGTRGATIIECKRNKCGFWNPKVRACGVSHQATPETQTKRPAVCHDDTAYFPSEPE